MAAHDPAARTLVVLRPDGTVEERPASMDGPNRSASPEGARWEGPSRTVVAPPADGAAVRAQLRSLHAPDVALADLAGRPTHLGGWSGRRRVLAFFATWCGCRDDLPTWDQLHRQVVELDPRATLIGIGVDRSATEVSDLAAGISFPILLDPHRAACDAFAVVNVPTVIWIDEHDRIVRANEQIFADNALTEHHGIDCGPHHASLLDWIGGQATPSLDSFPDYLVPDDELLQGRAEFRLACWLLDAGERDAAEAHLARAAELAPDDFTIRRAAIALLGDDPFGPCFVDLYLPWKERTGGRSYLPPDPS